MGLGKSSAVWVRCGALFLGLLALVPLGCNPQALSMLAMPFGGSHVDPEFKLFTPTDKEINLVLLTNFAHPEFRPEVAPVETELADKLTQAFRERCKDNKLKIKFVPLAQVRSYQLNQQVNEDYSPVEIGKHFKADYVLDLNIQSMELYEKKSHQQLYNATTEIAIKLYRVKIKDDEEHRVFTKDFHRAFPGEKGPMEASSMTVTQFRGGFETMLARDICKVFIPYDQQEEMDYDSITNH